MAAMATTTKAIDELQVVVFTLEKEEYCVPVMQVREIVPHTKPTRIPHTPPFIEGVINLRGTITSVLDLRKRFGLGTASYNEDTRIIVVDLADESLGFLVDTVSEVLRLPNDTFEPPPPQVVSVDTAFIQGVGKFGDRLLILLDLEKVLSLTELTELKSDV
jgi:purine-binding chemotaxis protein CheW